MFKIRISKADEADFELLEELNKLIFDDETFEPDFETGIWWIATHKDEAIGYAGLEQEWDYGYLCRVGILPSFRGKGLQKKFIRVREREARKLKLTYLVTDTRPGNYPSMNSLICCGFKIFKPENPWSFDDQLYWKKDL